MTASGSRFPLLSTSTSERATAALPLGRCDEGPPGDSWDSTFSSRRPRRYSPRPGDSLRDPPVAQPVGHRNGRASGRFGDRTQYLAPCLVTVSLGVRPSMLGARHHPIRLRSGRSPRWVTTDYPKPDGQTVGEEQASCLSGSLRCSRRPRDSGIVDACWPERCHRQVALALVDGKAVPAQSPKRLEG